MKSLEKTAKLFDGSALPTMALPPDDRSAVPSAGGWQDTRPRLNDLYFELWRDLIRTRCGLALNKGRRAFLERRLWGQVRTLKHEHYGAYYHHIAAKSSTDREWLELLETLLNHETRFFRHWSSFQALSKTLPTLLAERRCSGVNHLNIWSAGCSTGQEIYSLGICALQVASVIGGEPTFGLLGSDISELVLEKAKQGVFRANDVEAVPRFANAFFEPGEEAGVRVKSVLREAIRFELWNLIDPTYLVPSQDVIFCQNLLIYLEADCRRQTVLRLAERLHPGGFLVLAPAELIDMRLPGLELVPLQECLIYRRLR